jgi:hypothetical protein
MDMTMMGSDGVYRIYGFHEPDFTEPYVLDYRQLDPDQIRQWLDNMNSQYGSFEPPFDPSKHLDGRDVLDKTQLLQPNDIALIRARYQKHAAVIRQKYSHKVSSRSPLEERAEARRCPDVQCLFGDDCTGLRDIKCNGCDTTAILTDYGK